MFSNFSIIKLNYLTNKLFTEKNRFILEDDSSFNNFLVYSSNGSPIKENRLRHWKCGEGTHSHHSEDMVMIPWSDSVRNSVLIWVSSEADPASSWSQKWQGRESETEERSKPIKAGLSGHFQHWHGALHCTDVHGRCRACPVTPSDRGIYPPTAAEDSF